MGKINKQKSGVINMSKQRNFTSSQVVNDTLIVHLLEQISRPIVSSIERFLHIDTNSTTCLEFITVAKDGVEIFQDLITHNYVKVVGDIARDIEAMVGDKDL
jgi:hypothetical protein